MKNNLLLDEPKAILHSKRANIFYLEKCKVMVKGGRVLYLTGEGSTKSYWNIPIANTTVILLGLGTSITQLAVKLLASAGVLIGFSGSGGTPLISANEIEWFSPQSEYRPTEYVQNWLSFWFDEKKRLFIAKRLQEERIRYLLTVWENEVDLHNHGLLADNYSIKTAVENFAKKIKNAQTVNELLLSEAQFTKTLYKFATTVLGIEGFTRNYDYEDANRFLNHGNYLAYGLAATTLWVLGIPHGFAVMHGKTRRGALVFDVADLVKDALILPWAFICDKENNSEQEFRQQCLLNFTKHKALDFMFEVVQRLSKEGAAL